MIVIISLCPVWVQATIPFCDGAHRKQSLMITDLNMEDKKEFKSQATVEVIDNGSIKIPGRILLKDSE